MISDGICFSCQVFSSITEELYDDNSGSGSGSYGCDEGYYQEDEADGSTTCQSKRAACSRADQTGVSGCDAGYYQDHAQYTASNCTGNSHQ